MRSAAVTERRADCAKGAQSVSQASREGPCRHSSKIVADLSPTRCLRVQIEDFSLKPGGNVGSLQPGADSVCGGKLEPRPRLADRDRQETLLVLWCGNHEQNRFGCAVDDD